MGSKKFTLIELHLDGDTQFGPKSISDAFPAGEKVEVEEESADVGEDEAEESGGPGAVSAILGLVLLAGLAVAFKKFREGDEEEPEFDVEDEPDVIVS